MSAPERPGWTARGTGVGLAACPMDIVELAVLRGGTADLTRAAAARGLELPSLGRLAAWGKGFALAVRPGRWLVLEPPAATGATLAQWQQPCAGAAAAIELTCALNAFCLAGAAAREVLARGCRLDLEPRAFPAGRAAATLMVQVSVLLAALPEGWLLLTPATTARHLREWLTVSAQPFGLAPPSLVALSNLRGDPFS